VTAAVEPAAGSASILADLDAGRRRAALPDPSSPGGWRADPEVKTAILACFGDRALASWDLGGALRWAEDRAAGRILLMTDGVATAGAPPDSAVPAHAGARALNPNARDLRCTSGC